MSSLRKAISSLWVSRTVSIRVCRLLICHCRRSTKPRMTSAIVMKSPKVHWRVSNRPLMESNRPFISERRSSMRLLSAVWPSSSLFCSPSSLASSLASLSTISRSLIRGAISEAGQGAVRTKKTRRREPRESNSLFIPPTVVPVLGNVKFTPVGSTPGKEPPLYFLDEIFPFPFIPPEVHKSDL